MTPRGTAVGPGLLLTLAVPGCGDSATLQITSASTWSTEPAYEIGDVLEGDALFSRIEAVRVSDDGDRILVLEPGIGRLTVWALDGSLLMDLGGLGSGPGEFARASEIQLLPDGFYVRDSRRFTFFGDDGTVRATVPYPPASLSFRGFRLVPRLLLDDGGFLAVPEVPAMAMSGWLGDDPINELPVFRVSRPNETWVMDTLLSLRQENDFLSVGSTSDPPWVAHLKQPHEDSDQPYFDARTGTVVVVRKNVIDGRVELVEFAPSGDTVWLRELRFAPIPLKAEDVEGFVGLMEQTLAAPGRTGQHIRSLTEEALFVPEFYPGADYRVGMSRGEIWLRTFEEAEADTLDVWYAVGRGDESEVRRVLLPNGFAPRDVTATHVWGIRTDSLGVNYVAGRRYVRGAPVH